MIARICLSLVLLLTIFRGYYSLTHDEKVDKIAKAYMILQNCAHSIVDVHKDFQAVAPQSTDDLNNIKNSHTKMDYEVKIMKTEHRMMVAAAAKRKEVPTEQEMRDQANRGAAIDKAERDVNELRTGIATAEANVNTVKEQIANASLDTTRLEALQASANAKIDNPDEHISIPTAASTLARIETELGEITTVLNTITDSEHAAVKAKGEAIVVELRKKFRILLSGQDGMKMNHLSDTAMEIDALLVQLKQLDIYGSSSRMEL